MKCISNYVWTTLAEDFCISLDRMLIEFIEDKKREETWRGYVYAASMFVSAILQSLVLQQYFHIMFTLGMRVRSSVIGLLYEKVRSILHTFALIFCLIPDIELQRIARKIFRGLLPNDIIRGILLSCYNLLSNDPHKR